MQTKVYYDKKCPRCGYSWLARVENPKACPECKTRIWKNGENNVTS